MLRQAGVPYQEQVPDWPSYKQSTPFGHLPVYREMNSSNDNQDTNVELAQSTSIVRYLARKHQLIPTEPLQQSIAESIVDSWTDLRNLTIDHFFAKDGEEKKQAATKALESFQSAVPYHVRFMERYATKPGYYFGSETTVADLALFDVVDQLRRLDPTVLDQVDKRIGQLYSLRANPEGALQVDWVG
jgi:glutathione S-transferase